jgi:hypothetical protein
MDDVDICQNMHRGDENSRAAFAALPKEGRDWDRRRILAWLRQHGPAICEDVEIGTGMSHQTCSARISELRKRKQVVEVGQGYTTSGRRARLHGIPGIHDL